LEFSAGFGKRIGLGFADFCGGRRNFRDYFVDRSQIGLRPLLPVCWFGLFASFPSGKFVYLWNTSSQRKTSSDVFLHF